MRHLIGHICLINLSWEDGTRSFNLVVSPKRVTPNGEVYFEPDRLSTAAPGLTCAKEADSASTLFCPQILSIRKIDSWDDLGNLKDSLV